MHLLTFSPYPPPSWRRESRMVSVEPAAASEQDTTSGLLGPAACRSSPSMVRSTMLPFAPTTLSAGLSVPLRVAVGLASFPGPMIFAFTDELEAFRLSGEYDCLLPRTTT